MNVSLASMLPRALAAPEYRLPDYLRWLDGATRGSGPMWPDYLERDLMREIPVMPVPMLLISGARDLNTPTALVEAWFDAVEASTRGQAHDGVRGLGARALPDRNVPLRGDGARMGRRSRRGRRMIGRARRLPVRGV